eukprot:gnl/Carplike_NY0171/7535_a10403_195.p1 GENE.gnl/Carplike_NY0171/7535_a10403_195~~gnl/Carplike_NY0171/7535_a10403_195.p1  ORF type:complete len:132 (-),score=21.29 gnl/Carplike_NY0171/7535_a10403_195:247-642(-)
MSDAYSLGMSIIALFLGHDPYKDNKALELQFDSGKYAFTLSQLIKDGFTPLIERTSLFKSLLSIDHGEYSIVHSRLNQIVKGLTRVQKHDRMSVHEARKMIEPISSLLPPLGEGWKYPNIEEFVKKHRKLK